MGTYAALHSYTAFNLLIFINPQRDLIRLRRGQPEEKGDRYPKSLPKRIGWAVELTQNLRGVGWNWQIPSVPPLHKTEINATSAKPFFRRRAIRMFWIWLYLDFLCLMMKDIDIEYYAPRGNAHHEKYGDSYPIYDSLLASPTRPQHFPPPKGFPAIPDEGVLRVVYQVLLKCMRTTFMGSAIYTTVNAPHTVLSIVAVTMGCIFGLGPEGGWRRRWLDAKEWPDIFGGFRDGHWGNGILGWWGTAWHGLFKNVFVAPAKFINRKLNLPKGSFAAASVNLTIPFLLSGGLHWAGCFTQSGGGLGTVRFFMLQPFGIAFERIALRLYRRTGLSSPVFEKWVPYVWAFAWFMTVSGSFVDEYRYGGVWCVEPVPVGVARMLYGEAKGEWWYWGHGQHGWAGWDESLGGWGIRL